MSTPDPRPGGSHRATPPAGGESEGPPRLLLPLLSALVVLGAIGLAAWMLMTSGDDEGKQTDNTPTATAHTPTPTPEPSNTGDGQGGGDKNNGGKGNGNGKGDGGKGGGNNDNGGKKNNGGDKNQGGGKNQQAGQQAREQDLPFLGQAVG